MANEFTDTNVTGDVDVTGTVTAAAFVGDGSGLTNVPAGGSTFSDSAFRVQDNGDATKQIAFQASGIGTGTTRTITMPNTDVNLGDIATNNAKVSNATHTGDVTGSTVLTIAAGAIDIAMHSATGTPDGTTYYRGDNTWATPAGAGDMALAGTQTVTGAKTFEDATLILEGSSSGTTTLKANATAGTTTATFQAATGIVALTADIPADTDDLSEGSTNKYATAAEKTKLGYISVTQAVNLDTMESDIASLQGGAGAGIFDDSTFRIQDNGDNSKEIAFQASGISTGTVRTVTLQDASGTIAYLSDITGTNSGTNTGDQTITLTGDVTGTGIGTFAATISAGAVDIAMLSATGTPSGTTYLRGDNTWASVSGSGDVVGPGATVTDNAVATFDGTGGLTIQETPVTIAQSTGNMAGVGTLNTHTIPGGTGTLALTSDITVTASSTTTFTNKRITPRTGTTTSSGTPTINTDNVDHYSITALAEDITSMTTNLSGTPTERQVLTLSITGTAARAIAWGSGFENGPAALPSTTDTTKRLDTLFWWSSTTSKWRCMAAGSTA